MLPGNPIARPESRARPHALRYASAVDWMKQIAARMRVGWARFGSDRASPGSNPGMPTVRYAWKGAWPPESTPRITGYWTGESLPGKDKLATWLARQTLGGLRIERVPSSVGDAALGAATTPPAVWYFLIDEFPDWPPTLLEQAWLVAACEEIDRVVVDSEVAVGQRGRGSIDLFRGESWTLGPTASKGAGRSATKKSWIGKFLAPGSPGSDLLRSGDYFTPAPRGSEWVVGVRAPGPGASPPRTSERVRVLVTAPFLARGGAEQTLLETTRFLAREGDFDFSFVTFAPHRSELGDRRGDFAAVSEAIYSLGDLLHPAAMYGAFLSLVDSRGIELVYNANGSTLFYEFAERLRTDRPHVAIVDHLYDHRVGYITWYEPHRARSIDLCVAENHLVAEAVTARLSWPRDRAPVIWPCGRPRDEGRPSRVAASDQLRLRRELGASESDVLVLTAARVHEQKRPLDWVALAEALVDEPFRFVWIGGGPLEAELDRAIAASPGRLARLPFRDDVPELLAAADLACLVSDFEGLPVFLLEAMQAGCPFFGTDVGDVARVLDESGAGCVAGAPGDIESLARAAVAMLDAGVRASYSRAATAAAPGFDVPEVSARYAAAFRQAIQRRRC